MHEHAELCVDHAIRLSILFVVLVVGIFLDVEVEGLLAPCARANNVRN